MEEAKDCIGPSETLPVIKITLVADAHPLQVNPGIGFLRAFEGFSFVRGFSFPNKPFMSSWSGFSSVP